MKLKKIIILSCTALIFASINTTNINAKTIKNSISKEQQKVLSSNQWKVDQAYNLFISKTKDRKTLYKTDKKTGASNSANLLSENSDDTYPTRSGVILVTSDSNLLGFHYGHAGIVLTPSTTVESMQNGVARFPNTWNSRYNAVQGITVKDTTITQDAEASQWCDEQVGKPYNWNFFNTSTRSHFYCSQLVWAAFHDLYGINIDTNSSIPGVIIPVDLPNQSDVTTIYVK